MWILLYIVSIFKILVYMFLILFHKSMIRTFYVCMHIIHNHCFWFIDDDGNSKMEHLRTSSSFSLKASFDLVVSFFICLYPPPPPEKWSEAALLLLNIGNRCSAAAVWPLIISREGEGITKQKKQQEIIKKMLLSERERRCSILLLPSSSNRCIIIY